MSRTTNGNGNDNYMGCRGEDNGTSLHHSLRSPSGDEMKAVLSMCRTQKWTNVLNSVKSNALIPVTNMTMGNNISTTIIHQAITSKGDNKKRAIVIQEILDIAPSAASIRNGFGSLPLHVIAQRNTKMGAATKELLIRKLINAYPMALTMPGGLGLRTPLHIIFTDYVSPELTATMIQLGSRSCFMTDKNGFLPAHIACIRHCSPEKLDMLLRVNPNSLFETSNSGDTLLSLAKKNATKSHPNNALITDIRRRLNLSTVAAVPSVANSFEVHPRRISSSSSSDDDTNNGCSSKEAKNPRIKGSQTNTIDRCKRKRKRKVTVKAHQETTHTTNKKEDREPVDLLLHFSRHATVPESIPKHTPVPVAIRDQEEMNIVHV